ncbi:hypothetical protein RIVM261_029460 [Rivularia sp. IAM M-261]|nr:hypothetical protein RIVM261_029460 [Rivularia sp. IAM M-261]
MALRGLANTDSEAFCRSSLICLNTLSGKKASPRTSIRSGMTSSKASAFNRKGMERIVRTFCVMSSPVTPSPRVAPRVNIPFSYVKASALPSIFSSQTYPTLSTGANCRRQRVSQFFNSSTLKAFSKL